MMHRITDPKDPIAVYFDNQIGIVEVVPQETPERENFPAHVAQAKPHYGGDPGGNIDILDIIAARNEHEAQIGALIQEFKAKKTAFFDFVRNAKEGKRLIVKMKSHVSEDEIYNDFAKIYRRYKAIYRKKVGEFFFKETEDLLEMLCDDFEVAVRNGN